MRVAQPLCLLFCLAIARSAFLSGQTRSESAVASFHLKVSGEHSILAPSFSSIGNTQCDASQNIYFNVTGPMYTVATIIRVSPDGSKVVPYRLPQEMGKSGGDWKTFVDPSGVAYGLHTQGTKQTLVRFNDDGEVDRTTAWHVPAYSFVQEFAVLSSGQTMVSGVIEKELAEGRIKRTQFEYWVDQSGSMSPKSTDDARPGASIDLMQMQDQALTTDQNFFYQIRGDTLLVYDARGSLKRKLNVPQPSQDSVSDGAQIVAGRLGISYSRVAAGTRRILQIWQVVDPISGQLYGRFEMADDFRGSRLCYAGRQGFTYLTAAHGVMKLLDAPLP